MSDIVGQIYDVSREVSSRSLPAGEGNSILLRRRYDAPIEEVWNACTDPERINRWFLPITGELHLGGTYQLQGNAGGEILRCEPPHLLQVTWVFGDSPPSEVAVRLSPDPEGGTLFELEHTLPLDPALWADYGPGAVGVGWDLTLLGLSMYLRGQPIGDPAAWAESPEYREFVIQSSRAWGAAHEAAGASSVQAAAAGRNTATFYAPDPGSRVGGGAESQNG